MPKQSIEDRIEIAIPINISIRVGRPEYAETRSVALIQPEGVEALTGPSDDDPAAPAAGELGETVDLETARQLTNLAPGQLEAVTPLPPIPTEAPMRRTLPLDIGRAQAFLDACVSASPRVGYGLGAKVPFHGATPGRDFNRVDCSGFVRELIWRATEPHFNFPDGSVNQHDWVRAQGFSSERLSDAKKTDGAVRIAFLSPAATASHIGHVVIIQNGVTLESHGGVGPDSRPWTGGGWQAKAFVYLLKQGA